MSRTKTSVTNGTDFSSEYESESGSAGVGSRADQSSMEDSSLKTGEYYVDDDDDSTDGNELHINAPRKSGYEIAPGILRIVSTSEKSSFVSSMKYFQRLLQRHRIKDVDKHIEHLVHFDRSDKLVPHGEISKAIYQSISDSRNFDAYGRPLYISAKKLSEYKERHKQFLLGKKYKYIRPPSESEAIRKAAYPVFDHDLPVKQQPLTTAVWKVGTKEKYSAPVGFAPAPGDLLNSEGRESYYSYDGEWKNGLMHGEGTYLFSDGCTYRGYWRLNLQEGVGTAEYPVGSSYQGEWRRGKFDGQGVLECAGGTKYEGGWRGGRRWGKGKLVLPSGLEYDGEWLDGMPHGRGRLVSKLTGYIYEGSFEKCVCRA